MREMGKNQDLRRGALDSAKILVDATYGSMGVRDNHTKYEQATQRWRPGTGVASAGPPFQNLQFRAKISLFLP